MKNFSLVTALITFVLSSQTLAAGKARVEIAAKKLSGNQVEFTFKTLPSDGLAINAEGPWKLEIKNPVDVKFEQTELKRSEWKESDASFSSKGLIDPKKTSSAISYKLTAFICTKDKTQCFREVLEGKQDVKW